MRIEKDYLGEKDIPTEALYGIHAARAAENFPNKTAFHIEWYKSMGTIKQACYQTYEKFLNALRQKYENTPLPIPVIEKDILKQLQHAATKVARGDHFDQFIVPAVQGGAGTSINMNINEIIANLALNQLGKPPGEYNVVDPVEHANIFQSTNDTVPSALKIAVMNQLMELEEKINQTRFQLEQLESKYRNTLRIGYTQLQEAVPSSFGKFFGAYNEAFSRDWWRVSKAFERIKVINMGGSAIGTGITVPTYFIMEIVPTIQKLTNLPVTRSENLPDTTSNLDSFVEVHAILKSHAVNLEKFGNDIRLMAADFNGNPEIEIPQKQVGSSIMPGKVNPVIVEYAVSAVHQIYANDGLISSLSGLGQFELNAYIPQIGHALLESIDLLISVNKSMLEHLIAGIKINESTALEKLYMSPAITTALVPHIGYHKASDLAKYMQQNNCTIVEANKTMKLISGIKLSDIIQPSQLLKLGFQMNDIS